MSGNAGQGASAATLDARAPGRDTEGPLGKAGDGVGVGPAPPATPDRTWQPTRPRRAGSASEAAAAAWGARAKGRRPRSPPGRQSAGERGRERACELESRRNNKLSHMTRNQDSAGSERSPNIYQAPDRFQS